MAGFRDKLANSSSSGKRSNDFKVINMQSKKNYGSIFFVPFSPLDESDPVVVLNDVMEVQDHYKFKDKDGKEQSGKRWLKLLNLEDYKDMTADDKQLYKTFRAKGKRLNSHRYDKNDKKNTDLKKQLIRYKSYTIMMGWIIEHKGLDGKVINKNCPALLVFSSARFNEQLSKALKAKDKTTGSMDWQMKLFNRDLKRKMFLNIDYKLSEDPKIIGYIASVSIEKFDDETARLTGGSEEKGWDLNLTDQSKILEGFTNPLNIWLNIKMSDRLFNDTYNENLTVRLNKYLNRYLGEDNPLPDDDASRAKESDSKVAEKIGKSEDKGENLPPENKPKASPKDIWDMDGGEDDPEDTEGAESSSEDNSED